MTTRLRPQQLREAEFVKTMALHKEMEFYAGLTEGLVLIEGKKGSGKTALAVRMAMKLRDLFGRPPLLDFQPKAEFGKYEYFDEKRFVDNFLKASELARPKDAEGINYITEGILNKMGVDLAESTIVLDEAYKYFESRTPHNKLVLAFGYFISQSRHYKSTVIILVPHRDMIDKRVRRQVDVVVRTAFNPITGFITARVTNYTTGDVGKRLRVYGPSVFPCYDSWNPISMRSKLLTMNPSEY